MQSCITALFPMGDDVGEALAMAANSVGLKEMPLYEVEDLLDQDWVQQVEVSFYCASVYLCYVFSISKLYFYSFLQCLFNCVLWIFS
jgi:hypothetical protein